jgi:predicted small secreted protein
VKKTVRLIACLALLSCLALPLAACNTIEGIGKDTQAAGGAISNAAQSTRSAY